MDQFGERFRLHLAHNITAMDREAKKIAEALVRLREYQATCSRSIAWADPMTAPGTPPAVTFVAVVVPVRAIEKGCAAMPVKATVVKATSMKTAVVEATASEAPPTSVEATATATALTTSADLDDRRVVSSGR